MPRIVTSISPATVGGSGTWNIRVEPAIPRLPSSEPSGSIVRPHEFTGPASDGFGLIVLATSCATLPSLRLSSMYTNRSSTEYHSCGNGCGGPPMSGTPPRSKLGPLSVVVPALVPTASLVLPVPVASGSPVLALVVVGVPVVGALVSESTLVAGVVTVVTVVIVVVSSRPSPELHPTITSTHAPNIRRFIAPPRAASYARRPAPVTSLRRE
jgi:hypothetical protein